VGTEVKNTGGKGMETPLSFVYRTIDASDAEITGWSAVYNPDANTIAVSYSILSGQDTWEAFYTVNNGVRQQTNIVKDAAAGTFTISGVPRLDTGGVREGRPVSGVLAYRIYLEMKSGNEHIGAAGPVTIWNIGTPGVEDSGMRVSNTHPAVEISTQAELAAIPGGYDSIGNTYVLLNDIDLTGTWRPIGARTGGRFSGKFYGNGHRISINNIEAVADMGLFGVVAHNSTFSFTDNGNGTVRDLTVQYNHVESAGPTSPVTEFCFGGIAGQALFDARFENVQLLGSVKLCGSGFTAYA
jgi:hypothetical protein